MVKKKKEEIVEPIEVVDVESPEGGDDDGFGRMVAINDDWAFTSDSKCFALKRRVTVKKQDPITKKETGEIVESWKIEGFYGRIKHLLLAMDDKGIADARGNMTAIKKHIEKVEATLVKLPDLIMSCGELIKVPVRVRGEVPAKTKKEKPVEVTPIELDDKPKKDKKKKLRGWEK